MSLSKKTVQEILNIELSITDARIDKYQGCYYFSSDQLETHMWFSTCLYIHALVGFKASDFVKAVILLDGCEVE